MAITFAPNNNIRHFHLQNSSSIRLITAGKWVRMMTYRNCAL